MKNKLKLLALFACLFAGAGCGDECDPNNSGGFVTSEYTLIGLGLKYGDPQDSYLFRQDTIYKHFAIDSFRVIPVGNTPATKLEFSYTSDSSIADIILVPFTDSLIDRMEEKEYTYTYNLYFSLNDIDSLKCTFTPNIGYNECTNMSILKPLNGVKINYNSKPVANNQLYLEIQK